MTLFEPNGALFAVERLSAVSVLIASLESLARPSLLADGALAGWPVSQLSRKWIAGHAFQRTFGRFLTYPRVLAVYAIRAVCAALLLAGLHDELGRGMCAATIVTTSILTTVRTPFGHDGADQLATLTFVAVALAHLLGGDVVRISLWFVALQACLAYTAAGIAKLVSPVWQRGAALPGVLSTTSYGTPLLGVALARKMPIAIAGAWFVITFECLFPLALLGNPPLTYVLLACGAVFHLGAAVLMRLNTFLWSFVATYPAILFAAGV